MHKHVLGILVCMLLPICTASFAKPSEVHTSPTATNKSLLAKELIIIDAAVPNKHLFIEHAKAGTDVVEINSSQDGLQQLEQTLNQYKNLSALHLVSHAEDGVLYLGNSEINQQKLSKNIKLLSNMGHAFNTDADILFYGCDLAKTEKGNGLLDFISQQTNLDVAASNNLTGSALQGGDWELEVHKGNINTSPLFTASTMQSFDSVLLVDATLDLTALPLVSAPVIDVSIGGTDHVLKIESSGGGALDIQAVAGHVLLASAISTHTSVDIYLESGETFDLTSLVMLTLDGVSLFPVDHQVRITPYKGAVAGTAFVSDPFNLLDLGVTLGFSGEDWEGITKITIESSDGAILKLLALSHISIANVISLPSISNLDGDAFTYTEGSGVQNIDRGASALLTDPGLLTGAYTGGTLTAEITSGLISAEDTLTIDTSVVSLANNLVGGALTVSGIIIGELVNDILPGNVLSFTLNEFATPALLQILLQGLAYENIETDDPTAGVRVVSVTLTDADGETSNVSDVSITVASQNDAPTLINLDADILSYVLGSGSQYLDQGSLTVVADVDSLNFLDGRLSVSITNNKDSSEDILSLDAGVDVSAVVSLAGLTIGSEVSVGAVVVGTLASEIIEGNDLLIDLNANANIFNIQVLIRALVYLNTDIFDASLLNRTITITLNDGDGGTSTAQLLTVNLAAPTYDNDGTLTDAAVVLEPVALPLSADSIGEAVDLFDFTISDGGSADASPMEISQVVVNVAGTISETDLAKITWRLNSNTPNTDVENVQGLYNSLTDTITFLTPNLSIADGSSEILTVNAYFNDPTGLTHDNTLQLSIDGDTDLTLALGSTMDGNSTPVTNGVGSLITDNVGPTVTSVLAPANGTYAIGDFLSFTVNFDEAVNVDITAGTPRLAITIGENTRYIDYVSGNGSTALVFTYTLVAGDIDNDGLVLNTTLDLNLGTLLDAAGNTVDTTLNNIPTLIGVLSDGLAPVLAEVTSVVTLSANTSPLFTFSSSEVGTLAVGGACGSLNEGPILSGNSTITLTQIDNLTAFASGTYSDCTVTVTDAAGNATALTLTPFTIDLTAPTVDVNAPNTLLEGATDVVISNTNLSSSDDNASAAEIIYTLITAPINGSLINNSVGLGLADTFTQADINNGDITYSHNDGESTSDSFIFTVSDSVGNVNNNTALNFNFELTITPQNDAPTLLHLHDDTLNYVLNSGAQYLDQGSLTVVADVDSVDFLDGRLSVSITTNKDSSEDKLSLGAGVDVSAVVSLAGLTIGSEVSVGAIVVGTLASEIIEGNDLLIDLNADANIANIQLLIRALVYVNTDLVDPSPLNRTITITLEDGDGGTSTPQTINVSITSTPIDSDGTLTSSALVSEPVALPLSANTVATAVDIFDFTITDGGTSDGTPTVISHVAINVSGTTNDTDKAKITWRLNSNAPNTDVDNVIGVYHAIDDTITFDTPTLSIADGSNETLTVNAYYNDPTGLTHGNTLQLSIDGSTDLTLSAGSEMSSISSPVTNGSGSVITDDVGPIVTSVSAPTDDTYAIGETLTFTVNFDEAVFVNTTGGTPRLAITIGSTTRYVDYISGSGTNALTFTYTLAAGDIDSDGLVLNTNLDINSGTLLDALGNTVNTSLNNIPSLAGILTDGSAPILAEVTAVVSPTQDTTPSLTFSSSEAGTLAVSGSCGTSNLGSISAGNTTITLTNLDGFTPLTSGVYNDCTLTVTDGAGNSTELDISTFTIDLIAPSVDTFSPNTIDEGATDVVITNSNLSSSDNIDSAADITYTLVAVPSNGSLDKASVALEATDTFTQADINNGDITYSHGGSELGLDSFTFVVSDAAGNINNNSAVNFTFTFSITGENDEPILLNIDGDILNYVQGGAAQLLDQDIIAQLLDADSIDYNGGTFTLTVITNQQIDEDLLGFDNRIELSYFDQGGTVSIDGIIVGTLTEDLVRGNPLAILLNENATISRVQTLIRAITYENVDQLTATTDTRTIRLIIEDGDGGISEPQDMQVTITTLPADTDATVTEAAPVEEPVALPSSANASNRTVDLFDFTITDGGTSDGYPTQITQVIVNVAGTISETDLTKITWYLDSNAPHTDVNYKLGVYDASTSTISFATPSLSIENGTSEILTVKAFYHDSTGLSHSSTIELSVDGDSDFTLTSGTQMAVTLPVTNGSGSAITDNTSPSVTSVEVPTNETYGLGEVISFIVNFDENITIDTTNGTPRLVLTIGESVRYADYISGTGTTSLIFNYTVLADDIDGLILQPSIDVNGGALTDSAGNTVETNLNNVDDLTEILFDGDAPVLAEITPVITPSTNTTPAVTFSTSKAGLFAVEGACGSSDIGNLDSGEHTVTLTQTNNATPLVSGDYSDCTITITDTSGNKSDLLLSTFTLDITAPTNDVLSANTLDEGASDVIITNTHLSSSDNYDSADAVSYTLLTTPSYGVLNNNETPLRNNDNFSQADIDNGMITYTHDNGESASDSFTFSLSDSLGNINDNNGDDFELSLIISPINDAPISNNDVASTNEDTLVIIDVLANDNDVDGTLNKASVTLVTPPANGSASVNSTTGTISYTPSLDISGTDTFVYTVEDNEGQVSESASVTITIYPQNDAPTAQADTATTPMNTVVAINVAANDVDNDTGGSLDLATIEVVNSPSNGSAEFNSVTNQIDYTPNAAFYGTDTFSYLIKDNDGASSNSANVTITVTFVEGPENVEPSASDDTVDVQEDSSVVIDILSNDSDSDGTLEPSTVEIITMPSDGNITINMTSGAVTYTPNANFNGNDGFTYTVQDNRNGTSNTAGVTINVAAVADIPVISGVPTRLINEDENYSFTPEVFSGDGHTAFTFSIANKPDWAVFDVNSGSLTGIPLNADVGIYNNIQITVTDGETQASLPEFSLEVNNVNDAPFAVNDNYLLIQNLTGSYSLNVLENDYDEDIDDSITLVRASASVGTVIINDGGLTYQNSSAQTPDTISYTIEDASGVQATAEVSIAISPEESDNTPELILPEDITANATGLFTPINIGTAEAFDNAGNSIAVELMNKSTLFPPGNNLVYWRAEDSEGNFVIKTQNITINPVVNLAQDKSLIEGKAVTTMVYLNGDAPSYPFTIPYTVSGTSNSSDHSLISGEVVLTSGRKAPINFTIFEDTIVEENETIVISLDESVNQGSQATQTLSITEANLAPEVDLIVTQLGEKRFIMAKDQGEGSISAMITDANTQDTHTISWASDIVNTNTDNTLFSFNPELLDAGMHTVNITVADNGVPSLSVTQTVYIEITNALAALSENDSDGDSIPDNLEGHADDDNDGIPNYLDGISDCQTLHTKVDDLNSYLMEGDAGACLRIGSTIADTDSKASLITTDEAESALGADSQALFSGGIFDFIAYDLPTAGQSYHIVIPQRLPIPAGAMYRKYNQEDNWHNFVSDDKNKVYSTLGSIGYCPAPGSELWTEGLTAGHWCVQLLIEDGGPNDDDKMANGTIVDPSGVASPATSNNLPVAVDDVANVRINLSVTIDALSNDTDADGHALTLMNVDVDFGTATIEDNKVLYVADSAFIGTTNITYTLSDSEGGTATANIALTVEANQAPVANDDSYATTDVQSITLDVLSNDTDAEGDLLTITSASASSGSVTFTDTEIVFTPTAGTEGVETVDYEISDNNNGTASATAYIVVTINEAPTANSDNITISGPESVIIEVLENDSDIDDDTIRVTSASALSGSVTFVDDHIVYTPPVALVTSDTISYQISDEHGNTAESTVNVSIVLNRETEFEITNSNSGGSLGYLSCLFFMLMLIHRQQILRKLR